MTSRWARRTCERCGRSILVAPGGSCPHCDPRVAVEAHEPTVQVRVTPATPLPDVCLGCGERTHRRVALRMVGPAPIGDARHETQVPTLVHLLFGPAGCLLAVLGGLADAVANRRPTFRVRVPQCGACGRRGNPTGGAADFANRRVALRVHPRFAAALDDTLESLARDRRGKHSGPRRA